MELIIEGIFMILAFGLGFYCGKPEKIKEKVKIIEKKEKKREKKGQELDDATVVMLRNIDAYDGTGLGQEDVPEEV